MANINELADPSYWNAYYSQAKGHEWFQTFTSLQPFFHRHLLPLLHANSNLRILHLGSGDSTIPSDLREHCGAANQLCVDFSAVVVEAMTMKETGQGIEWRQGDVRDMGEVVSDESVDVTFDKGTLDAMIYGSPWQPPDDVVKDCNKYMDEVLRVLKPQGVFLYITYRQPHFIKPLINARNQWKLDMEVLQDDGSSFDYHAFILRKAEV